VPRPVLTVFAGLALLTGAVPASAGVWRETSERVLPATGLRAVRAENPSGLIQVRASQDGRVHVTALKVIHGDSGDHLRLARGTRVEIGADAGVLDLRVSYPSNVHVQINFWDLFNGFEFPRVEVHLSIDVPPGIPVTLSSASGDLNSDGLTAPQSLSSSSGDITVRNGGRVAASSASGDLFGLECSGGTFQSTSGDVAVEGARGPVVIRTSSGDATIKRIADSLSVETVSGDIRVDRAPRGLIASTGSGTIEVVRAAGRISVESASGDLKLGLEPPLAASTIATGSGDIEARFASGLGCELEVRTSNGTLDAALPIRVKSMNRHMVSATVGKGGAPLTIRSSSGDIHVTSGGN
jgi:putative adhesin